MEVCVSSEKVLSFDEFLAEPDIRYEDVEIGGGAIGGKKRGILKIGSVSSADILEWFEENENPATKKFAGLRLAVKSIVNPDGSRIPADKREAAVTRLSEHDAMENGLLVNRCLMLNGLRSRPKGELVKNESSETPQDVSHIVSPLPPVE
jgi:hypothetical protein